MALPTFYTDMRAEVINKLQNDVFYSYFNSIDESVLSMAFDNAYNELYVGVAGIIEYVDGVNGTSRAIYFATNLVAAYLVAFTLKPYLKLVPGTGGDPDKWVIEDAGAMPTQFRTVGTQSMDGVAVSFESERLSVDISTPLEQWLSTTSWGFRCIQPIKDYTLRKGRIFVV